MNFAVDSVKFTWYKPFTLVNIALTIFTFLAVGFSLLVYRQTRRMNEVLPTPLAPWITTLVIAYIILTLLACFLALGIVFSS